MAEKKPNPYQTGEHLIAAIEAAGSIEKLAFATATHKDTIRRWRRELEVDGAQRSQPTKDDLADLDDAELVSLLQMLGITRLAKLMGVTESQIKKATAERGVEVPTLQSTRSSSPRVHLLSTRIRQLEREDAALKELAQSIRFTAQESPLPKPAQIKVFQNQHGARWETPVDVILHVSDKQYGQIVDDEEVPGGGYSPEIYQFERLPRYLEAVVAILEAVSLQHPIDTLWILNGGDFVEGADVYKGQHHHLSLDAGEQVSKLGKIWAQAVSQISATAKSLGTQKIVMTGVVGNHGVHGGRNAGATPPTLNYDWLCYTMTATHLEANTHIDFIDTTARRAVYIETQGHIGLLTHGDQDKGGGMIGAPVVTAFRNDLRARQSTNVNHKWHWSGHFHKPTAITVGGNSGRFWNGAWLGSNNLSIGKGGAADPTQSAYVVHPEWGIIQHHPIRLIRGPEGPVNVLQPDGSMRERSGFLSV